MAEKTVIPRISVSSDSIPCDSHDSPRLITTIPAPKALLPATLGPTFEPSAGQIGTDTLGVLVPQPQAQSGTCDELVLTLQPESEAPLGAPKDSRLEHASSVIDFHKHPNHPQSSVEDILEHSESPRILVKDSLEDPGRFPKPFEDISDDPNRLQAPVADSLEDPHCLQASVEVVQDEGNLSELDLGVETKIAQQSFRLASQALEHTEPTTSAMPPKASSKSSVALPMAPKPTSAAPVGVSSRKLLEMRAQRNAAASPTIEQKPSSAMKQMTASSTNLTAAIQLGNNTTVRSSVSTGNSKHPASVQEPPTRTTALSANASKKSTAPKQNTKATTSRPTINTKPVVSDRTSVSKISSRLQDAEKVVTPAKKPTSVPTAVTKRESLQVNGKAAAPPPASFEPHTKSGFLPSVMKPPLKSGTAAGGTKVTISEQKAAIAAVGEHDIFSVPVGTPRKRADRPRKAQAAPAKRKAAATRGRNITVAKKPKAIVDDDGDDDSSDENADDHSDDDEVYHSKPVKGPTAGTRTTRASRRSGLLVELGQNSKKGPQKQVEKGSKQTLEFKDNVKTQPSTWDLAEKAKMALPQRSYDEASLPQDRQDESIEEFEQSMTNIHDSNHIGAGSVAKRQVQGLSSLPSAEAETVFQGTTKARAVKAKGQHTGFLDINTGETQDDPVVLSDTPSGESSLSDISSDKSEDVAKHEEERDLPAKKPMPRTPFQSSPPLRRQKDAQNGDRLTEKDLKTAERKDAIQKPHMIGFDQHGPKNQGTLLTGESSRSAVQNKGLNISKHDKVFSASRHSRSTNSALDAMQEVLASGANRRRGPPIHADATLVDGDTTQLQTEKDGPPTVFDLQQGDLPSRPLHGEPGLELDQGEGVSYHGEEETHAGHGRDAPTSDSEYRGPIPGPRHQKQSPLSETELPAVSIPPPQSAQKPKTMPGYDRTQDVDEPKTQPQDQVSQKLERHEGIKVHPANVISDIATARPDSPAIYPAAPSDRHNVLLSGAGYDHPSLIPNVRERNDLPVKRPETTAAHKSGAIASTKRVMGSDAQEQPIFESANHIRALVTEERNSVRSSTIRLPTKLSRLPPKAANMNDYRQQLGLGNSILIPTKQEVSAETRQRGLTQLGPTQGTRVPQTFPKAMVLQMINTKHYGGRDDNAVTSGQEEGKRRSNQSPVIASIPKSAVAPISAIGKKQHVSTQQVITAQQSDHVALPAKPRPAISTSRDFPRGGASLAPLPPPILASIPAKIGVKRYTGSSHGAPSKRARVTGFNQFPPSSHKLSVGTNSSSRRLSRRRVTEEGSPVRSEQEQVYSQQQDSEAVSDNEIVALETSKSYFHNATMYEVMNKRDPMELRGEDCMLIDEETALVHDESLVSKIRSGLTGRGEESQAISDAGFHCHRDYEVVTNVDPSTHAEEDPFVGTQKQREAEHDQPRPDGHSFLSRLKLNTRHKACDQAEQPEEQSDDNGDDVEQEAEGEEDEAEDPDRTLVEEDYVFLRDHNEDGSSQSSEEPDKRKVQFVDDFEERMHTLRPYQHDFHHGLFRLAHELSRHLIKAEDAIRDLVQDYHKDCLMMIEEAESSHRLSLTKFFEDASKKQDSLASGFEAAAKILDRDMDEVESSHEAYSETRKGKENTVNGLDHLLQRIL